MVASHPVEAQAGKPAKPPAPAGGRPGGGGGNAGDAPGTGGASTGSGGSAGGGAGRPVDAGDGDGGVTSGPIRVSRMRTEYRINPLGIDVRQPRLDWQLVSDQREQRQTAYQ